MNIFETLTQSGLNKKEAGIYEALLESGTMSLSDIHKATHINRPALYKLLPILQRKGLVSQIQKQKRIFYRAESPRKIITQYKNNHQKVLEDLNEIDKNYTQQQTNRPVIKYYEGKQGIGFVFDDIAHTLPRGGRYFRYTSRVSSSETKRDTFYYKTREAKQIERLVIASEDRKNSKKPSLNRQIKAIPKEFDLFEHDISMVIYGDKIAYIDYGSQTSFIVESAKVADFQSKLFRVLWKKL